MLPAQNHENREPNLHYKLYFHIIPSTQNCKNRELNLHENVYPWVMLSILSRVNEEDDQHELVKMHVLWLYDLHNPELADLFDIM